MYTPIELISKNKIHCGGVEFLIQVGIICKTLYLPKNIPKKKR